MKNSEYSYCHIHCENRLEFFCYCKTFICICCVEFHKNHKNFKLKNRNEINKIFEYDSIIIKNCIKNLERKYSNEDNYNTIEKVYLREIRKVSEEFFKNLKKEKKNEIREIISKIKTEFNEIKRNYKSNDPVAEEIILDFICNNYKEKLMKYDELTNNNYYESESLNKIKKENLINEFKTLMNKYFKEENQNSKNSEINIENISKSNLINENKNPPILNSNIYSYSDSIKVGITINENSFNKNIPENIQKNNSIINEISLENNYSINNERNLENIPKTNKTNNSN